MHQYKCEYLYACVLISVYISCGFQSVVCRFTMFWSIYNRVLMTFMSDETGTFPGNPNIIACHIDFKPSKAFCVHYFTGPWQYIGFSCGSGPDGDSLYRVVFLLAWWELATSHYLIQCWSISMSTYAVTRPPARWALSLLWWPPATCFVLYCISPSLYYLLEIKVLLLLLQLNINDTKQFYFLLQLELLYGRYIQSTMIWFQLSRLKLIWPIYLFIIQSLTSIYLR